MCGASPLIPVELTATRKHVYHALMPVRACAWEIHAEDVQRVS
jgi:hypothetical protein